MKVLLSAYACEPSKGSEPEVGLRTMLAAARRHDVWVLTRQNNLEALDEFLDGHPASASIRLVGLDHDRLSGRWKKRLGTFGIQWYYREWQRLACQKAEILDREVGFDVVHHITFSSYWTPVGVACVDKPLVIGPLGGGVSPPFALMPDLGSRGLVSDGARIFLRWLAATLPRSRRGVESAAVILAQNPETAARLHVDSPVRVVSNALSIDLGVLEPVRARRSQEVVVTGRLIPLKGGVTAVRVLRHLRHDGARLVFIGEGSESGRIMRLARRLGVDSRVEILGWQPRERVIRRVRRAGVLLHTAIHDEAGMTVAEALSLGTPVVGYDHGGPAQVMRSWPHALWKTVRAGTPSTSARRLADAVDSFLDSPPGIPDSSLAPDQDFAEVLLETYKEAVNE
jgi:glycosyltransferase involved in cell wall biosynthesis